MHSHYFSMVKLKKYNRLKAILNGENRGGTVVTGLASGVVKPGGWQMALVLLSHRDVSKGEGRYVFRYLPSLFLL